MSLFSHWGIIYLFNPGKIPLFMPLARENNFIYARGNQDFGVNFWCQEIGFLVRIFSAKDYGFSTKDNSVFGAKNLSLFGIKDLSIFSAKNLSFFATKDLGLFCAKD